MKEITIGNKKIGPGHPVFIIAEAGVNHDGDLEIAKKLVDVAAAAGADAVKFQSFVAERLNTRTAPKAQYHIETTGTDAERSWFDRLKKEEFTPQMHYAIRDYCQKKNIIFLSTPYDELSADLLETINVPAYKIAGTDLTNIPLLQHVARKGKPVLLSTAMGSFPEIEEAVAAIRSQGNEQILLFQSVGEYPPQIEDANVLVMQELQRRFQLPVGYSDNGPSELVPIIAAALGCCSYEKHFTLSRHLPGPDHRASLEPEQLQRMVQQIRQTSLALGHPLRKPLAVELRNLSRLRKSVVAALPIPAGARITREMVMAKRPGTGVHPRHLPDFIGKKAKRDIREDELLTFEVVEP